MGIYSIVDVFRVLVTSIDGFNALLWVIVFIVKFFNPDFYGEGSLNSWNYLLFALIVIIMFIRLRSDCHEKKYFHLGSFVSVTVFSLIFVGR